MFGKTAGMEVLQPAPAGRRSFAAKDQWRAGSSCFIAATAGAAPAAGGRSSQIASDGLKGDETFLMIMFLPDGRAAGAARW